MPHDSATQKEEALARAAELHQAGRLEEAMAVYREILASDPAHPQANNNLGNALCDLGRTTEAVDYYRRALAAKPDFAGVHNNLGAALWEGGALEEAVASFRRALALKPDFAGARINLGNVLFDRGEMDEAIVCYRAAIAQSPDDVEAYGNLGIALWDRGRLDEAEALYRQCLALAPADTASLNNLAALNLARNNAPAALDLIRRSLAIAETPRARKLFADVVQRLNLAEDDSGLRALMTRALNEVWARPGDLALPAAALIRQDPAIGVSVARANASWPGMLPAGNLLSAENLGVLERDGLLAALLCAMPNMDVGLERFLTMARHGLLERAVAAPDNAQGLAFFSALARQCFINEYVFFAAPDESAAIEKLREKLALSLESGRAFAPLALLALASYGPLHAVPGAAKLLERAWPAAIAPVLAQQIAEPLVENSLRATIPELTAIEDEVSRLVRRQYEENPYPRWVRLPPPEQPVNLMVYLGRKFPLTKFPRRDLSGTLEVLVAGCGTGQQSINTAERNGPARVLAVDLSLASLAYAARKTQERGTAGIRYAQADILMLGALERRFDLIECSGVLHHLADPWAGLEVLLGLLKPGGFMKLGFYSALARRDVVKARAFIAAQGYCGTADEIRACRQQILDRAGEFPAVVEAEDFFSVSVCRDLIFHVQEHRMTLSEIASFLDRHHLTFLGFEVANEEEALAVYRRRFPQDKAAVSLGNWALFEEENPKLFSRTYLFWVQKNL